MRDYVCIKSVLRIVPSFAYHRLLPTQHRPTSTRCILSLAWWTRSVCFWLWEKGERKKARIMSLLSKPKWSENFYKDMNGVESQKPLIMTIWGRLKLTSALYRMDCCIKGCFVSIEVRKHKDLLALNMILELGMPLWDNYVVVDGKQQQCKDIMRIPIVLWVRQWMHAIIHEVCVEDMYAKMHGFFNFFCFHLSIMRVYLFVYKIHIVHLEPSRPLVEFQKITNHECPILVEI